MTRNLTLLAATTIFAGLFGGVAHASAPSAARPPAAVDTLAIAEAPLAPGQMAASNSAPCRASAA